MSLGYIASSSIDWCIENILYLNKSTQKLRLEEREGRGCSDEMALLALRFFQIINIPHNKLLAFHHLLRLSREQRNITRAIERFWAISSWLSNLKIFCNLQAQICGVK